MSEAMVFQVGVMAFWVGAIAVPLLLIYTYIARPLLGRFKAKGIHVFLDLPGGVVHVESAQSVNSHQIKLGCGEYDFHRETRTVERQKWHAPVSGTVNVTNWGHGNFSTGTVTGGSNGWSETIRSEVPTGSTTVTICELDPVPHYHQQWRTLKDGVVQSRRSVTALTLSNSTAAALERWVKAHGKHLRPNLKRIRKGWDDSCKKLRRECQSDPKVRALSGRLELMEFNADPHIRYLALGKDGKGLLKPLQSSDFVAVEFDQLQLTDEFIKHGQEQFRLSPDHIAKLHGIRRRWQRKHRSLA